MFGFESVPECFVSLKLQVRLLGRFAQPQARGRYAIDGQMSGGLCFCFTVTDYTPISVSVRHLILSCSISACTITYIMSKIHPLYQFGSLTSLGMVLFRRSIFRLTSTFAVLTLLLVYRRLCLVHNTRCLIWILKPALVKRT